MKTFRLKLLGWAALSTLAGLLVQPPCSAVTLKVVDGNGVQIPEPFRWLIEEDNTALTVPGVPANDTISLVIHKSHAAVVTNGSSTVNNISINVPSTNRYVVSVLADGYALGGATIAAGQEDVRVVLNRHPIPTAQISILVFHDNNPINNAPDATEAGLSGFKVILADVGGGPITQDAFGNPLGTVYRTNVFGEYIPDPDTAWQIETMGDMNIYSDTNGKALIKNLAMGKYGVQVIPPTGTAWSGGHAGGNMADKWMQTATIEGTLTVDAWVTANEPSLFLEGFGPGFYHVFFGFVDPNKTEWATNAPPVSPANMVVRGTNIFNHFGRPPNNQMFAPGPAVSEAWVGLNEIGPLGLPGRGLYIAPCADDSSFVITNVPPGVYQLVTWDKPLDALFGFHTITVTNSPTGFNDLGNVLSYRWFGTFEGSVFYDDNTNGFREATEEGIPMQAVNLRFRDGRVYMGTVTDIMGDYQLSEVFPFFKWLVAEVDFARFKATGMTAIVDEGGTIPADNGWAMPSDGVRNPQPQYQTDPTTGVVLTNGSGQPIAENNPNTGNNLSRTETGPVLTEAMHLFLNQNNRIDWGKVNYAVNENGGISGIVFYSITRAENDPAEAVGDPWEPGIPRVQMALYSDTNYDKTIDDLNGDGITLADVDNYPLGWADGGGRGSEDVDRNGDGDFDAGDALQIVWTDSWDDAMPTGSIQVSPPVVLGKPIIGSDNYSTWNQIRPGVFDGGYAFTSYFPGGMASGSGEVEGLPSGRYIVQAAMPPGYEIQTEESRNVDFGDAYIPSALWLPPECVGELHMVPTYLTLFPDQQIPAPFAGQLRPLADRKWVEVSSGKNAAADFHMYTDVPKAARVMGFVLNDLTAEFNAQSPIFGEKGAAGWLPISFRDWAGHEVARAYSDEYGTYNAMLPSTYTVNVPSPSGVAPNMLTLVLNDPTMPDPNNPALRVPDPHYNPNFSTTPWTFHYYPGSVSYLDTPIVPIAANVGFPNKQMDVEPATGTPMIGAVTNVTLGIAAPHLTSFSQEISITALGPTRVPNPELLYNATNTIVRDFGFGESNGLCAVTIDGVAMRVMSWTASEIRVRLPNTLPPGNSWQLMVTRGDNGMTSQMGITLSVGGTYQYVAGPVAPSQADPVPTPIQDAIDAAPPGGHVFVAPGVYDENPVLWKAVRLQGAGVRTIINANPVPGQRLTVWHAKVTSILGGDPFTANEAPGIMVLGSALFTAANAPRIDGFQIMGSIAGAGISLFTEASNLKISNNRIIGNQGTFAGGVSLGMQGNVGVLYNNTNVTIAYNQILKNGGNSGGGGIAIYTGASGYRILNNQIIGNFCRGNGGGISHQGCSPGGLIANNIIRNNEVFYGVAQGGDGGGISIAGELVAGGVSPGAGSVALYNNLIQGNLAGSGHGGGIRAAAINGADVGASSNPADWYGLDILNNIVVNNAAGFAGGGIWLKDATKVRIIHNTVANNDSLATAQGAFIPPATDSTPQGAGIVSSTHDPFLAGQSGQQFCDPVLENNIVWHNRSFSFHGTSQVLFPDPDIPDYRDLEVFGAPLHLNPINCVLSANYPNGSGNLVLDPFFVQGYVNTNFATAVIDEAGNNIGVRFEPTGARGNYHLSSSSPAVGSASTALAVAYDFDYQERPTNGTVNIGADHYSTAAPVAAALPSVSRAGPPAQGTPPGVAPPIGPGVPPGQPLPPVFAPMPMDMDGEDTDGDGIVDNDHLYVRLAAGDGFVKMADGNELYCFGFSDHTAMVNQHVEMAMMEPDPETRTNMLRTVDQMVMMDGTLKAEFASPTLVFKEGQKVYLDLSNVGMAMRPDLFDPHTVHFHGFPNAAVIFDGEPMGSISVNMGATLRYFYQIVEPGTYLYHCHVEATEHMAMGMIGNLWVLPKQNNLPDNTDLQGFTHHTGYKYAYNDGDGSTRYDVDYPLQISGFDRKFHEMHIAVQPLPFATLFDDYPLLNGRGYPDTINLGPIYNGAGNPSQKVSSLIQAEQGQKILLRVSNVSIADFQTLTVLEIPMRVVGKDARLLRGPTGLDLSYETTSVTLGGGETADVILDTTAVPAGTYFVYATRLNHLANDQEDYGGLMTEIVITAPTTPPVTNPVQ